MKASKICKYLEQYFPLNLQEKWDVCGLQVGSFDSQIDKVMVALNADEETLDKAIVSNCQMLITHHPFLLEDIKNFNLNKVHGRFLKKAIDNDIVIYSLHTCLDKGKESVSMNDWLIHKLNVKDVENYDSLGIGKKGTLVQSLTVQEFVKVVKETYGLKNIRYNRNIDKVISKVAICGGSAASDISHLHSQVDCFITGDTKHGHMKMAIDNNVLLIDIGHHAEVIMEEKVHQLLEALPLEVVVANSEDYYVYS